MNELDSPEKSYTQKNWQKIPAEFIVKRWYLTEDDRFTYEETGLPVTSVGFKCMAPKGDQIVQVGNVVMINGHELDDSVVVLEAKQNLVEEIRLWIKENYDGMGMGF